MSREVAAEAAAWVARLHGPARSTRMERECQAWLAASEEHRLAFERCTEVWQEVPRLSLADAFATQLPKDTEAQATLSSRWQWAGAMVGLAAAVLLLTLFVWPAADHYATDVGESRHVVLDDGSRLRLNSATRVHVLINKQLRSVGIETGEVLFEVARDVNRPFVVRAGGHEVRALGTVFWVKLLPSGPRPLSVTLIEGEVAISGDGTPDSLTHPSPLVLEPGERVQFAANAAQTSKLDRPQIEHAMAWTRGEVVLDNLSLAEAVAEMNRYSRQPIVLAGGPDLSSLRVCGVFRAGDSTGFADAVASLHGLVVRREADRLLLKAAGIHRWWPLTGFTRRHSQGHGHSCALTLIWRGFADAVALSINTSPSAAELAFMRPLDRLAQNMAPSMAPFRALSKPTPSNDPKNAQQ